MAWNRTKTSEEIQQINSLLKQIHFFKSWEEGKIRWLSQQLGIQAYQRGEPVFQEGERADGFYIILDGEVGLQRETESGPEIVATLSRGDYFGESALLEGKRRTATAETLRTAILLRLDPPQFSKLLRDYPAIQKELIAIAEGYRLARSRGFDWLSEDETLYLVARKHVLTFIIRMLIPTVIWIVSAAMFIFGESVGFIPLDWLALFGVLIGVVFAAWYYLDWQNDFYIVTDKRVIWLEEIYFLYDSREEASLSNVLSVNVSTNLFQRWFGFGDIVVRTYTGSIIMRDIGQPNQFADLIEQYWYRARELSQRAEKETLERIVRKRIGMEKKEKKKQEEVAEAEQPPVEQPEASERSSGWSNLDIFRMRFEQDGVITYRKHWFLLLQTIWEPTLAGLLVLVASIYVLSIVPNVVLGLGLLLTILVTGFWWGYKYMDWRNDRYQVTHRDIFDLDKKPFGQEIKKSAPLENILSIESKRPDLIARLLNFGNVIINVGDATFNFIGVSNPSVVQQEVFNRQEARKKQLQDEDVERDRDTMLELISIYHDTTTDLRKPSKAPVVVETTKEKNTKF